MNQIEIINSMTADNIDNIKSKETQLESSLDIEKEKQESKGLTQMLYNSIILGMMKQSLAMMHIIECCTEQDEHASIL